MNAVLHPEPTKPVSFGLSETVEDYLNKCERNIRAEIWGLYHSRVNPAFPGWRDRFMSRAKTVTMTGESATLAGRAEDLSLLDWNLLVIGSALHLAINARGDGTLRLIRGMRIEDPFYRRADPKWVYAVGFVRPFVKDLDAIASLRKAAAPPLLSHIASPATRAPFAYAARPFSDAVPSNAHQRGVVSAMSATIECIQGPPGTGKSTTIFHILHTALPPSFVAIVTCVQNRAVDAVAEKLCGSIDFVVLGNQDRLGESARRNTLDAFASQNPAVGSADRTVCFCTGIVDLLQARLARIEGARTPRWWPAYVRWRHRGGLVADIARWKASLAGACVERQAQWAKAQAGVMRGARAFLCTMDSLSQVPGGLQSIAIVDEAGTVPEYKLPLLVALGVRAVVCIGDQNQLEPFTHSSRSTTGFFQRAAMALHPVPMLVDQYRMHPAICDLVSGAFYGGSLVTAHARRGPAGGIRWVDYDDGEETLGSRRARGSVFNQTELDLLRGHMRSGVVRLLDEGRSVMVITFYKEQFQRLAQIGEDLVGRPGFRIATVDSAQGSEADVVLLSCVRSNPRGAIGFLSNPNRLCVALSRARHVLCVVGRSATLCARNPVWIALHAAAATRAGEGEDPLRF